MPLTTSPTHPPSLVLTSETLEARFDDAGSLTQLRTADGRWTISTRPELAQSFRLHVPLADRRFNYIHGRDQKPPAVTTEANGNAAFAWDRLQSEHGGWHDISVRATVTAVDGRLVFSLEVDNRSDLVVESVHYPCLGEVRPPDPDGQFTMTSQQYIGINRQRLWPTFDNHCGYYGVDTPTQFPIEEHTRNPFVLLEDGDEGVYAGVDVPTTELVSWFTSLHPGHDDSIHNRVPSSATIGNHDVAIRFEAVHVPYVMPGDHRTLTPIALQAYRGDWHHGADIYTARRTEWNLRQAPIPPWTSTPHSWQQIQVNSAEDHLRVPFRELPEIARECAERGVTAIQVVGWNDGGQDRHNPSHAPDPKLGGATELAEAIHACHQLGVKVILFTKFTWADRATARFQDDLARLSIKDPYGDYYVHHGWKYHTATQLLDLNTRRLVPMCFSSDEYLDIIEHEFASVVDSGADGMLYDECFLHAPARLCFDTSHGHRYGESAYTKDREFIRRLRAGPASEVPEFLYAGEGLYDLLFEEYQMSYIRTDEPDHTPYARYLRPRAPIMVAVKGFDDRSMVNQCLLYRYVMSYEPFYFKGRLPDAASTVAYGQQMDALRTELRTWFWDGTFRHTLGATVRRAGGSAHHPYAVYEADGELPAVAVANYAREPVTVSVVIDRASDAAYQYRLVDDPRWRAAPGGVELPPESAAVVVPA